MDSHAITLIVNQVEAGDAEASTKLFKLVYSQLKDIAAGQMKREQFGLEATGLVHEAFLKLFGHAAAPWESRRHFFGAAAQAMRQILIDLARSRLAKKRGGDQIRITFCDQVGAQEKNVSLEEVIDLNAAIDALQQEDELLGKIVELRFFTGQSMEAIAQILDMSLSSVERKWRLARAFLVAELQK